MILVVITSFQSIPAEEDISVDVSIIDQSNLLENDKPVIVAGLWHTVTFTGINFDNDAVILTMYKGTSIPTEKNNTNYYGWKHTPVVTEPWQRTTTYGNGTIKFSQCKMTDYSITYCVGIPDNLPGEPFYNEEWTMELSIDDGSLFSDTVYLQKPTRGFAKSHGDRLSFFVDPFTEMQTSATDYLILKNTGNVPLNVTLDFKEYNTLLTYTEASDQIPANDQQSFRMILDAPSWKPQRIRQSGSAKAVVSEYYLLDEEASGTTISLQAALVLDVPAINIFVGHSNFELTTLDESSGFSFQHQKSVSMSEGETRTIYAYLSGDGTATISIETNEEISFIGITRNDLPAQSPFTVISTDSDEQVIGVQVKALSENRDGLITYTLETESGTQSFSTGISVGPPTIAEKPSPFGATSTVTIVVLLALICVVGIMLYNHLRYGRRQRR